MQRLQEATGYHADIIPGIITDTRMGDSIQLILIVTGISENNPVNIPQLNQDGTVQVKQEYQDFAAQMNKPFEKELPQPPQQEADVPEFEVDPLSQSIDLSNDLSVPAFLRRRGNQI